MCSVGIIDSSTVRMNAVTGIERGFDGNKKIKGLKRHMIVDSLGLLIDVVIHSATKHDSKGAIETFNHLKDKQHDEPNLSTIFADAGYRGKLKKWVKKTLNMDLQVVHKKYNKQQWQVQPKRWIVERTFAWLLNFRRLVINYERTTASAISYINLAMICLMVKNVN